MKTNHKNVAVVGVGNLLMKDEGVGVHILEYLAKKGIPENVSLFDAGTAFSEIISEMEGYEKLIIVDAVHGGGKPGTVYCFEIEDVQTRKGFFLSLHDVGVIEALQMERLIGKIPERIIFMGIEPFKVEPGMELSPEIMAGMEKLLEMIFKEIKNL